MAMKVNGVFSGGSLFLFDRKTLRYFRKDGHQWRKKKDGKTIREAHEKLKSGSVDVLHCYYAHGEENENLQRRSYWMLDGLLEHIVLVHYREVNEGGTPEIADIFSPDSGFRARSWGHRGGGHPSYGSSPSPLGWSEHAPSSEVDGVDSGRGFGASPPGEAFAGFGYGMAPTCEDAAFDDGRWTTFSADDVALTQVPQTDFCNFEECGEGGPVAAVCGVFARAFRNSDADRPLTADSGPRRGLGDENEAVFAEDDSYSVRRISGGEQEWGLKREDDGSWGWLSGEMGQVCDVPVMAAKDAVVCCWNSMDAQNEEDLEISSLSRELNVDLGSPGPWLAQEQLFSIVDYSPDWAYSGGQETKVLISGSFLGEAQPAEVRWSCMFGEVEVPAEVLSPNALRCYAPYLSPGRVPLYVTRSNRLACSEIREFEYRPGGASSFASPMSEGERANLQARFARIVLSGGGCADCAAAVEGLSSFENDPRETLVQTLLGCRLREWLFLMKFGEDGKGARVLDEHGQGAIHLAAALGYDWAIKSIVAAGVSPNFRDARGWTPLHWAAHSGREETVMTLVTLGSSPSAVADPTAEDPQGRTAADVASSRGHKGISGYLAEADLTDQLSTLDLADRFCGQPPAGESDARGRLGETMRAVQTSAEAAARIRSALGGESLRRWGPSDGVTSDEDVACAISSRLFRGKVNDGLRVKAAERIQHKYRGWSGRREFLKMRRRIVKIQAHVRGHQVRRQYKKFLWSVGIVEKAILRWRRRGRGLRGFRGTDADGVAGEEYDFLAEARMQKAAGVERALARVQSMARRPEGRVQYKRMVAARKISSFRREDANMSLNCHRQEEHNDASLSNWATR